MIQDFLFIASWSILIPVFLLILKVAKRSVLVPSALSILLIFLLAFQYLGFPILYFKIDDYRAEFVTNNSLLIRLFYFNVISFFMIFLGYIAGQSFIKQNILEKHLFFNKILNKSTYITLLLFIFSILGLYLFVERVGFSNLALIVALQSLGQESVALARSEMSNAFSGNYHWYKFFMRDLLYVAATSFFLISLNLKSYKIKLLALFSLLACIFSSLISGEKGIIIDLISIYLIGYFLFNKNKNFKFKHILFVVVLCSIILVVLYTLFMGNQGFASGIYSIFSRLLTGSLQPAYHYLEFFPKYQDFLFGRSFPNPLGIFPFEPYNLTFEVMNWVNPSPLDLKLGIVGSMPTIFWGEFYANFGFASVVLGSVFVGLGLSIVDEFIDRRKNDPLIIAFCAWLIIHYKDLSITGISGFIIDFYLIILSLIVWIMFLVRKNLYILFSK